MATLPPRPNLDHLRRQARDLLRAARAGDDAAMARIGAVAGRLTLAAAQLAVAREYGFASWARLAAEVQTRTMDLAQQVEAFCEASIRDGTGRAARMLAANPAIAGYNFATAVILGDSSRVRREIERHPDLVARSDDRGWTALHAVCASRWHRLDPDRADGLLAVARLLLEAGADHRVRSGGPGSWTPLRCAVAGAANPPIARLLLEYGAVPDDQDLYLAGFGDDNHQCLRLLLDHVANVTEVAQTALAAPISANDTEGVRLLLAAGTDPRRYVGDDGGPVVYEAIGFGCAAELVEELLAHGAEPDAPGADGRSPYRLATDRGRTDLAALLRRYGADDDATDVDLLLSACLRADQADAQRLITRHSGLADRLTEAQQAAAIAQAAEAGRTAAVGLMLDLGFHVDARREDGGTALHAAAYSGSADVVTLLVDHGADIEARDLTWDSTPLDWAAVGSGERSGSNPRPDWPATVGALLEAGASTRGISLSPDDPKLPSADVALLLWEHGIGPDGALPQ
jgi:ankyrin repeat protein